MTYIITSLDEDEHIVLELASRGQAMLAIGRWKDATEALYERGLLNRQIAPGGGPEFYITYYGKVALKKYKDAEAAEGGRLTTTITNAQDNIRSGVTRAAEFFAQAARQSAAVTGDSLETALRKWIAMCQDEALKRIRQ
jgi:hypothetical protein